MDVVKEGFLFVCCLLQLSSAQDMSCTVTQDDKQTTYNISGLSHVSDHEDEYSWANSSNHVLANNEDKLPGLVLNNSINTLVTSKCIDKLVLTRSCISKKTYYTAICEINCTLNAPTRSEKDKEISYYLIAGIVAAVILLLLVLIGVLLYKYKDETLSCGQLGYSEDVLLTFLQEM